MRTRCQFALLLLCLLSVRAGNAADLDSIGEVSFPASADAQTLEHFHRGLAYLHNFGWKQARYEFQRARALEPGFAMAYWGEAMSWLPLLQTEGDLTRPRMILENLGPDQASRLTKAPTALEKGFLLALDAYLYTPGDALARRQALLSSMESLLVSQGPQAETLAWCSLALLSVALEADTGERSALREKAAAYARDLTAQNPLHPGAVHYLLHSLSTPELANQGLEAAERYRELAPLVSHARHMPTHIYLLLGQWDRVAEMNENAFYTARALWEPGDSPADQNHILDWGQYGDLQMANYAAAEDWIVRAEDTLQQNPGDGETVRMLSRLKARYIIESQQWEALPVSANSSDDALLAAGLSAVAMRDLALASLANQELKQRLARSPDNLTLQLLSLELDAAILAAAGEDAQSREIFQQAITLFHKHGNQEGLPEPLKPLQELYGETLLRAGQPRLARDQFLGSLQTYPRRPLSLLGLARSYVDSKEPLKANEYYRLLLDNWGERNFIGFSEARTHLSLYDPEAVSTDAAHDDAVGF